MGGQIHCKWCFNSFQLSSNCLECVLLVFILILMIGCCLHQALNYRFPPKPSSFGILLKKRIFEALTFEGKHFQNLFFYYFFILFCRVSSYKIINFSNVLSYVFQEIGLTGKGNRFTSFNTWFSNFRNCLDISEL